MSESAAGPLHWTAGRRKRAATLGCEVSQSQSDHITSDHIRSHHTKKSDYSLVDNSVCMSVTDKLKNINRLTTILWFQFHSKMITKVETHLVLCISVRWELWGRAAVPARQCWIWWTTAAPLRNSETTSTLQVLQELWEVEEEEEVVSQSSLISGRRRTRNRGPVLGQVIAATS